MSSLVAGGGHDDRVGFPRRCKSWKNGLEIQCSGASEYDEGSSVAECVVSDREAVSGTGS